ncbi:MAG: SCO family protein, partial [Acidimicrobiales bacterium]
MRGAMVLTNAPAIPASGAGAPRRHRGVRWALSGALVLFAVAGALGGLRLSDGGPPPLPASVGITEDRALPPSVLGAPLVDEHGTPTSLAGFRGRIVVLTPFLTSCQETCPLTTGALLAMQRDVAAAGLARRVVFVEASVDPVRDVPSRLAAYARATGANWPLLTGTPVAMATLWHAFGVYYQQVPEGSPPGTDWQTGAPYAYDVDHSDGFVLLGPDLHERFVTAAAADLRGLR